MTRALAAVLLFAVGCGGAPEFPDVAHILQPCTQPGKLACDLEAEQTLECHCFPVCHWERTDKHPELCR